MAPKASEARPEISAIVALRAIACLLVVYCHLVGRPLVVFHEAWPPATLIADYVLNPLGIIQNFGLFGVAIFFFVSGFIITHSSQRDDRYAFFVKRAFRIYPPLFVAVAATALLAIYARSIGWTDQALGTGKTSIPFAAIAMEFLVMSDGLIGVTWTITIEIFFYVLVLILAPVMQRRPAVFVVLIALMPIALITALRFIVSSGGAPQFGLAASLLVFIPTFAIGAAVYFAWSGRISVRLAVALGALAWIAFIYCLRVGNPRTLDLNYPAQFGMALAVFLAFLWLYRARPAGRILSFYADISYSLYLVHLPFGVAITMAVYPRLGLTAAIVASIAVTTLLASAMYRLVELPSQKAARTITGQRARASGLAMRPS